MTEPCEDCKQPEHCATNGCFADKARSFQISGHAPSGEKSRVPYTLNEDRYYHYREQRAGYHNSDGTFVPYVELVDKPDGTRELRKIPQKIWDEKKNEQGGYLDRLKANKQGALKPQ